MRPLTPAEVSRLDAPPGSHPNIPRCDWSDWDELVDRGLMVLVPELNESGVQQDRYVVTPLGRLAVAVYAAMVAEGVMA